jgi:hypothetical protein
MRGKDVVAKYETARCAGALRRDVFVKKGFITESDNAALAWLVRLPKRFKVMGYCDWELFLV